MHGQSDSCTLQFAFSKYYPVTQIIKEKKEMLYKKGQMAGVWTTMVKRELMDVTLKTAQELLEFKLTS